MYSSNKRKQITITINFIFLLSKQNSLDPKMNPKDSFIMDRPKSASNFYS